MKTIVALLIFAVVFLSGALYGVNQQDSIQPSRDSVEQTEEVQVPKQKVVEVNEAVVSIDQPEGLAQKTASVLESSVKGFYDIIVQLLYQISLLFF